MASKTAQIYAFIHTFSLPTLSVQPVLKSSLSFDVHHKLNQCSHISGPGLQSSKTWDKSVDNLWEDCQENGSCHDALCSWCTWLVGNDNLQGTNPFEALQDGYGHNGADLTLRFMPQKLFLISLKYEHLTGCCSFRYLSCTKAKHDNLLHLSSCSTR